MRSAIIPAIGLAMLAASAFSQTPLPELAPSVRSLFPLGGRRGETVEVEIRGRHLDGARSITFTRSEIRAQILASEFFSLTAKVIIGPAAPTGLQEFRLTTELGSYTGVFVVGSLPEAAEKEPNNDLAHAQAITLPTIINGLADAGDYDLFRFHAEAGQTLIFDLVATRANSRLDATLGVLDARGNELDFNDDYYIHKDPHLTFPVKTAGDYFVRVSASGNNGNRFGSYRLIAGAVPFLSQVLPEGAKRGAAGEFRLAGVNLKGVDRVILGDSASCKAK